MCPYRCFVYLNSTSFNNTLLKSIVLDYTFNLPLYTPIPLLFSYHTPSQLYITLFTPTKLNMAEDKVKKQDHAVCSSLPPSTLD